MALITGANCSGKSVYLKQVRNETVGGEGAASRGVTPYTFSKPPLIVPRDGDELSRPKPLPVSVFTSGKEFPSPSSRQKCRSRWVVTGMHLPTRGNLGSRTTFAYYVFGPLSTGRSCRVSGTRGIVRPCGEGYHRPHGPRLHEDSHRGDFCFASELLHDRRQPGKQASRRILVIC